MRKSKKLAKKIQPLLPVTKIHIVLKTIKLVVENGGNFVVLDLGANIVAITIDRLSDLRKISL